MHKYKGQIWKLQWIRCITDEKCNECSYHILLCSLHFKSWEFSEILFAGRRLSFAHPKSCIAGDRLLDNQDLRIVQRQQLLDLNFKKADRESWKGKHGGKDQGLKMAHYGQMTQNTDSFIRNEEPGFFVCMNWESLALWYQSE